MRRETRRKQEEGTHNILYIGGSILAIGIIAFAVTFIMYGNKMDEQSKADAQKFASLMQEQKEDDDTQIISTQMGKSVGESKNEVQNTTAVQNTKTNSNTTKSEIKNDEKKEANQPKEETKQKEITFTKPVEGEIVKEFAKEKLVYSDTLKEWTTHMGIDIKANKTTVVKAVADGKVKSIKNDPRYGLSVMIEHQDGYETLYANLLSSEFIEVGENVKQGDSIGTVGDTAAFEIVDEPHLHFELLKDNVQIDPAQVIK